MSGFGLNKTVTANVTPSTIVFFDKVTPTTVGVVFDPNTPATTDILYISNVDASTWIWDGSAYISYAAPSVSSTEWYLYGTTIDAGSNKTASIQRSGAIFVNVDSYFYDVRVGRGNGSISSNTIVGDKCLLSNTTGTKITAVGAGALQINTASNNTAIGWGSLNYNSSGNSNTGVGSEALTSNITGSNNSGFGYAAGEFLANGSTANSTPQNSVFLGHSTRSLTNNDTNQIVIGYLALGKGSNTVQLGNTSITATYLQGEVNINPVSGQISRAIINSDNNVGALLSFRTANLPRWAIRKDGNETGSNVGGDLSVRRYDDAGAFIDTPISIKRSTGVVTLNSAYSLPTTDGTSAQALTTNGSGVVSWTTIASAIPQAQVIYVDSANGINATTGRGDINKPYLTPEYALSNITNTGTFTANTATNTTLSAISDINNALLEIGMYVSGSGIPFGTIIVAKGNQGGNANTVTLSKLTTATATGVTITWWKIYEVRLNGSFIVTSNLFKQGFYINSQTARISWGNLNLFDLTTVVLNTPYFILGNGNYFGTHIGSRFINGSAIQPLGFTLSIEFGNIETISTTLTFAIITEVTNENYIKIKGVFVNCRFGTVGTISAYSNDIDFNSYGLLGGVSFGFAISTLLKGSHTTPSSITVLSSGYGLNSIANLTGSTSFNAFCSHRGRLNGTTHTIAGADIQFLERSNGSITCTGSTSNLTGSVSSGSLSLTVNSGATVNIYGDNFVIDTNNGAVYNYGNNSATIAGTGTTNNIGSLIISNSNSFNGVLENYGTISAGKIGNTVAYTVRNYGRFLTTAYGLGGVAPFKFYNYGIIESYGTFSNATAMIVINNASAIFDNYGKLINNTTDVVKALIEKTTGTLYLRQGSYLKVSNSLSPIRCTANTSASKDVYYFGVTDNCNGTTYGLGFAFDGSSFAPNDLVGGTLYENVNY